jgi:hypothetical protein
MRKISKAKLTRSKDVDFIESRPHRVTGSTITSWPGPVAIDLVQLFAQPTAIAAVANTQERTSGPTIGGASGTDAQCPSNGHEQHAGATVSLSDGTKISFVTAHRIAIVDAG